MQRSLGDLNRQFYEQHASAFVAKRDRPWPGWKRVLAAATTERTALRVLDVGCGNGRLGAFLDEAWDAPLEYVGIDASQPMIDYARKRFAPGSTPHRVTRFVCGDLIANAPADVLAETSAVGFDLCCAFGLLHHIPGEARRAALFAAMAEHTQPGGVLAASFWRFDAHERFRLRFREASAPELAPHVDVTQLEVGDHLVAWGDEEAVRYCHAACDEEIESHIEAMRACGLRLIDDFASEGPEQNLNRYVVFERTRGAGG